jgi:hypothetical protein
MEKTAIDVALRALLDHGIGWLWSRNLSRRFYSGRQHCASHKDEAAIALETTKGDLGLARGLEFILTAITIPATLTAFIRGEQ